MLSIRGTAGGGRRGVFSPRGTAFVSPLKIGPLEGSVKSAFDNSGTTTQDYCGVRGEHLQADSTRLLAKGGRVPLQ